MLAIFNASCIDILIVPILFDICKREFVILNMTFLNYLKPYLLTYKICNIKNFRGKNILRKINFLLSLSYFFECCSTKLTSLCRRHVSSRDIFDFGSSVHIAYGRPGIILQINVAKKKTHREIIRTLLPKFCWHCIKNSLSLKNGTMWQRIHISITTYISTYITV